MCRLGLLSRLTLIRRLYDILCGIHGVGKSYFCEQIKRKIDIETYTASELISAEKEEFFSSDKHNKDIDDNQKHLLSAVRKLDSKKASIC